MDPFSLRAAGVDLTNQYSHKNMINTLNFSDPKDTPWMLLGVYGTPYQMEKQNMRNNLKVNVRAFDCPWLCGYAWRT